MGHAAPVDRRIPPTDARRNSARVGPRAPIGPPGGLAYSTGDVAQYEGGGSDPYIGINDKRAMFLTSDGHHCLNKDCRSWFFVSRRRGKSDKPGRR